MTLFQEREVLPPPIAAASLVIIFGGYILTCLVILHSSKVQIANAGLFLTVSLPLLASLLTGFAIIYKHTGLIGPACEKFDLSWSALYFSVITWTTVGYGDFQPTPAARPYAALEAIAGLIFTGLFISTLVHIANKTSRDKGTI
jgi:hypothetical protein